MLPKNFKFASWRYSKFESPSDSGSRTKVTYSGKYDSDGRIVLEETGVEDVYSYIQSFADDCDLNVIMEQFERSKDADLLNRAQGFYIDASELPKSWPEIFNAINYGKEQFNKMPPDFKEVYGNDFAVFASTFDPADFVGSGFDSAPAVVDDGIKEGVSDES